MTPPDPVFAWTAEGQRVQFAGKSLDASGRVKEAARLWKMNAALAGIIEQISTVSLARLAAELKLAQRYDEANVEVLLAGVRNIENAAQ